MYPFFGFVALLNFLVCHLVRVPIGRLASRVHGRSVLFPFYIPFLVSLISPQATSTLFFPSHTFPSIVGVCLHAHLSCPSFSSFFFCWSVRPFLVYKAGPFPLSFTHHHFLHHHITLFQSSHHCTLPFLQLICTIVFIKKHSTIYRLIYLLSNQSFDPLH